MAQASGSQPFRGHSPPRWLFSHNAAEPPPPELAPLIASAPTPFRFATTRKSAGLGARLDLGANDEEEEEQFTAYGPTLRRRGNVRFVKAKLPPEQDATPAGDKGKGRAADSPAVPQGTGTTVRGLYESIVGLKPPTPAAPTPPPASTPTADIDLTLDDSSDDSDDDCIVIDPITNLPLPPRARLQRVRPPKPRPIHELLPAVATPPLVPPTNYAIGASNVGYRMLAKQGWIEGQGLGPKEGVGLKVPLRAVAKNDRRGLGDSDDRKKQKVLSAKEREEEKRQEQWRQKELRGRGERGMARTSERDARERRALLAYMNR